MKSIIEDLQKKVEKVNSRAGVHVTFDHNINSACLEMVTDIYVNGISDITGNIIIDITILHSIFFPRWTCTPRMLQKWLSSKKKNN